MEKTFGPVLFDMIHRTIPKERYILFDTKKEGRRPDTMKMLKDVYVAFKAEGEVFRPSQRENIIYRRLPQPSSLLPTPLVTQSSCEVARRTACTLSAPFGIHKRFRSLFDL